MTTPTYSGDGEAWRTPPNMAPRDIATPQGGERQTILPIADQDFVAALGAALETLEYRNSEHHNVEDPPAADANAMSPQWTVDDAEFDALIAEGAPPELPEPEVERLFSRWRSALTLDRTAAACGLIGFFAGALVWHLVGFWGFVSAVAFNGDLRDAPIPALMQRALAPVPKDPSDIITGSITPAETTPAQTKPHKGCVTLSIDYATGSIVQSPCSASAEQLRDAGRQHRSDRAPDLGRRAVSPGVSTTATNSAVTEATLGPAPVDDAEFDLQLRPGP